MGESSRFANEGDIGIYYRLPKFVQMFKKHIPTLGGQNVLEIGGGIGEMYENLSAEFCGDHFSYTITEYSSNAVNVLTKKYAANKNVSVSQADAQALPFNDNSFDVVCAFDVMHHVENPRKMAREMLRVSKRHIFMCEACGLSLIRKVTEMTEDGKLKGETSYTPKEIRSYFMPDYPSARQKCSIQVTPFYFFVPPKIPKRFMPPFIIISEIGQRVPFIRWQSQSMAVYIDLNTIGEC